VLIGLMHGCKVIHDTLNSIRSLILTLLISKKIQPITGHTKMDIGHRMIRNLICIGILEFSFLVEPPGFSAQIRAQNGFQSSENPSPNP
jgi:hypothetical protein